MGCSGLATLGMTGHCAYFGLFDIGRPKPGDTVVVSGAAGAIGTVALQLARLSGGRTVGIAGYNSEVAGLQNHLMLAIQGASMAGFFYFDHVHRLGEANDRLAGWLRGGDVQEVLDVAEGFDAVPDAALGQFAGRNLGKQLVRIADDV